MKKEHNYYVYVLASQKNGTLYVGVTSNLKNRIYQHRNNKADAFTKKYNIHTLVWYERYGDINFAINKEKQIKAWKRQWKINLINENNQEWKDLYGDLY